MPSATALIAGAERIRIVENSIASPLLLVAVFGFVYALFRLHVVQQVPFGPFHVVVWGFLLECVTLYFPFLGFVTPLSQITEIFMVAVALTVVGMTHGVGSADWFQERSYFQIKIRFERTLVTALLCVGVICSLYNFRRLGAFPLQLMAANTRESYVTYGDLFLPFFTPLSWGCGRTLAVLLGLKLAVRRVPWSQFLKENWFTLGATSCVLFLNLLDGLRNTVVLAVMIWLAAIQLRGRRGGSRFLLFGAIGCLTLMFLWVGNLRIGSISWLDSASHGAGALSANISRWFFGYLEPNIQNLNAMLGSGVELSYGAGVLSSIVPDFILMSVGITPPPPPIELLSKFSLLPHSGLTFRTVFADLYPDFGLVGSWAVGSAALLLSAYAYRKTSLNQRWLAIYLILVPGICYAPFMNFFVHLYNVLPYFLIMFIEVGTPRNPAPVVGRGRLLPRHSLARRAFRSGNAAA